MLGWDLREVFSGWGRVGRAEWEGDGERRRSSRCFAAFDDVR